ncbi:MAG: hypothetical protein AAGG44_17840 [Planctomycetota bacterium]
MKIDWKHLYHGAALTQITEHESFKALNKADDKYGHYLVNTDRRLLAKHSEKEESDWSFTFQTSDVAILKGDFDSGFTTFVVLICGAVTICLLDRAQIEQILDIEADFQQWVKVSIPKPRASMWVSGSKGKLTNAVSHKGFPDRVFE